MEFRNGYQKVSTHFSWKEISNRLHICGDHLFYAGEESSSSPEKNRGKKLLWEDHLLAQRREA
jgi:hypothetical protein